MSNGVAGLDWLSELDKIMAELPAKYLDSAFPEMSVDSGHELELVGRLTELEKRLLGAVSFLIDKAVEEDTAHELSHVGSSPHANQDCLAFHEAQYLREDQIEAMGFLLTLSLRKRLSLPESDFLFDGYDVYSLVPAMIKQMRDNYAMLTLQRAFQHDEMGYLPLGSFDLNKFN